jgi:ribosomal protein S18 acetylase RimI-like enzyme
MHAAASKDWRRQLRSGEREDDRFTGDKGIRVALHDGPRDGLRELFELAEDSSTQLDSYMDRGRVLVAVDGQEIVGHLQVVAGPGPSESEIKNMAVRTSHQRRGIGRTLVTAVIDLLSAESCTTLRSRRPPPTSTTCASTSGLASAWPGSSATPSRSQPATRSGSTSTG